MATVAKVAEMPDETKFRELLLYVAAQTSDDPAAGATKINKVLYYAEFGHMRATGRPITGVEYQKLPNGPAPRRLLPIRNAMIEQGDAMLEHRVYLGYNQVRLVVLRAPRVSVFTSDEIASIDQAIAALGPMSGTETSDLSHDEVGWQMVDEGETIPYEAAYLRPSRSSDALREYGKDLAAKLGLI